MRPFLLGQTCIKCDPFKNVSLNIIVKFWDPRKKERKKTLKFDSKLFAKFRENVFCFDYRIGL